MEEGTGKMQEKCHLRMEEGVGKLHQFKQQRMEEGTGKLHQFNTQTMEERTGKMQHKCHLMVKLVQFVSPLAILRGWRSGLANCTSSTMRGWRR